MTVFKGVKVSDTVDKILENLSDVCNYHRIRMNGGTEINSSALMRCVFDNLVSSPEKGKYLNMLIRDVFKLKTLDGEPISDEMITNISHKVLNNVR